MAARPTLAAVLLGALSLLAAACTAAGSTATPPAAPAAQGTAVCGAVKAGPAQPPAGAVVVDPAVPSDLANKTDNSPPGTTFWLKPGTHILGDDEFSQVAAKAGDHYIGAPGAVVDGRNVDRYAFTGKAANVTIEYLTITRFRPPTDEGAVNHDSGSNWTVQYNTLIDNRGAAAMGGENEVLKDNCFKNNGQYGLNGCCGNITGMVLDGNEFVGNNADNLEAKNPGCGCTGGMKFWEADKVDIRNNWIHDNHGPGIWADTNNNDFLIEHNVIENNDGTAIFYEASYNAIIRYNTIRRNDIVEGQGFVSRGDNFPSAAIYLSESGGDPRVPARTNKIEFYGNTLIDNWSGLTLWENADRFCNSPANSSTGICTLVQPDLAKCVQPGIASQPLNDDCRWRTQNVDIHDNSFSVNPAAVGCDTMCARMAILSNYGSSPDWSPYKGEVIEQSITFNQNNHWHHNTYVGPWTFMTYDTTRLLEPGAWQAGPYNQDQGSTFASGGGS